jgi:hypothetical protein
MFGHYEARYRRIAAEPRYTGLAANRQYFASLYARIEANRHPVPWWLEHHPAVASDPDFPAFYDRFYAAVAEQAVSAATNGPRSVAAAAPAGYATN